MSSSKQLYGREIAEIASLFKDVKDAITTAHKRAADRAVRGMKTDALKEATSIYTAPRREIAKRIAVNTRDGHIRSRGRPFRSIHAKHRKNRRPGRRGGQPVFLKVKKKNSGDYLRKSGRATGFIATMSNGSKGIFRRTGKFTSSGKEELKQFYSPGVVNMLHNKKVREKIEKGAYMRYHKELEHQYGRMVKEVLRR